MKRFIISIFSLYIVLAVIVSAIHIAFEYNNIRDQIYDDLGAIYTSSSNSLATAMWDFDTDQTNNLLKGLLTLEFISGVEITNSDDDFNIQNGDIGFLNALVYESPIFYREADTKKLLGTMKLYTNQSVIIDRIKVNVAFIIFNAFIKTFFLSMIMLIVGNKIIGKPLEGLLDSIHRLDFGNENQIKNSKMNVSDNMYEGELSEFILAYNKTLDNILIRTKQRDEARKKLEDKNFNLKVLVNEKTIALQEKMKELNELNKSLEVMANTDFLTGLINRRHFFERVEVELDRLRRENKKAAILSLDIDFFKSVNDKYGHAAGDAVLVMVADRLKQYVRKYDLVARFGGEEFNIFLYDVNFKEALAIAERMRVNIGKQTITYEGDTIKVTSSFGLVMVNPGGKDINYYLDEADKFLYEAKEAGRNVVKY